MNEFFIFFIQNTRTKIFRRENNESLIMGEGARTKIFYPLFCETNYAKSDSKIKFFTSLCCRKYMCKGQSKKQEERRLYRTMLTLQVMCLSRAN